ncbi:hypothetical protein [Terribacillus aidingensis]|uniref:hypothetical protein n=1 Tax=Terribacillus aidingensis TaxID=586416 RepID=UPI000BE2E9BD|nr:hypothetical protein [Terribacillus aidingensis]
MQFLDTKGGQSANQGNGRSNNNSIQSSNSGYDQDSFRDNEKQQETQNKPVAPTSPTEEAVVDVGEMLRQLNANKVKQA